MICQRQWVRVSDGNLIFIDTHSTCLVISGLFEAVIEEVKTEGFQILQ